MSFNMWLLVLGIVFGIGYFAKRNYRRQREMRTQARRARG